MSEQIQAALEKLEQGLAELLESGQWAEYLRFQSKFHKYSFGNTMLIYLQCPGATHVAGYQCWRSLGRQVRKGEKGIRILAPCTCKVEDDEQEPMYVLRGFKPAYVFDIGQTDGEALPETVCNELHGDDEGLFDRLEAYARSQGIVVELDPFLGCNGVCRFSQSKAVEIRVLQQLSPLHRCKTLAHELGHALLHSEVDYRSHRGICELEAESTAFVVLDHFGFDSQDYSFGYVASWTANQDTLAELQKAGSNIQKAARNIIEAISASRVLVAA
jgi:antirestriction protein ArdC